MRVTAGLPRADQRAIPLTSIPTRWGKKWGAWFSLFSLPLISLGLFRGPFLQTLFSSNHRNPAALEIANLYSHGRSIICLGDSLTQGVGATSGHDYPALLSKKLGLPVINAGVDGDETIDALKRLDADVLAKDPKLVIVALGANDFRDGQSLQTAFKNLDEIVRRIEAHGAIVVLVGIPPGLLGDVLQKNYDRIIKKYRTAFVPKILEDIITDPHLKSTDKLHPNNAGYELIAKRIQHVVVPLVKQDGARNH